MSEGRKHLDLPSNATPSSARFARRRFAHRRSNQLPPTLRSSSVASSALALHVPPENHIVTSAGDMKIIGRDKCLPAVMSPLLAMGDVKVGTLTVDSFFVGQHLSEDSSRLIRFDQRWKPFMGFNDDKILEVKLWRHPRSRLPVISDKPITPPKKSHNEQAPLEDPFAMFNQKDMDPTKVRRGEKKKKQCAARPTVTGWGRGRGHRVWLSGRRFTSPGRASLLSAALHSSRPRFTSPGRASLLSAALFAPSSHNILTRPVFLSSQLLNTMSTLKEPSVSEVRTDKYEDSAASRI